MTTETIKRERHGSIEHVTVRQTFRPYNTGHAIHNHTRVGRYPRMLQWFWIGQDERGTGWFAEYWGNRDNGGQMRRRVSMNTALKAVAETAGADCISVEPETDAAGRMSGNVILTKRQELDWGALGGAFSITGR